MIAPPQELICLDKLEKCFGLTALLKVENIRLDVATAYVLTGMNGAGKTVFLRILAGLEKADVVSCRFMGRTVRLHPYPKAMRDAIVYVHQHPIIFNMSVEKNIAYGLRVRGLSGSEIMRRTHEAMEWAELSALRSRMPNGLSGGEKQKIALARAKILQPKLLLLDEPSANLDGKAREQVISLIPALVAEGTSVVVACHDRDLVHLPGIRHLKLRDGKIEDRGIKI